jgi:hypothetical protein
LIYFFIFISRSCMRVCMNEVVAYVFVLQDDFECCKNAHVCFHLLRRPSDMRQIIDKAMPPFLSFNLFPVFSHNSTSPSFGDCQHWFRKSFLTTFPVFFPQTTSSNNANSFLFIFSSAVHSISRRALSCQAINGKYSKSVLLV